MSTHLNETTQNFENTQTTQLKKTSLPNTFKIPNLSESSSIKIFTTTILPKSTFIKTDQETITIINKVPNHSLVIEEAPENKENALQILTLPPPPPLLLPIYTTKKK